MQYSGAMMYNKLIIAGAGSGKTTFLTNEAIRLINERVLITTYTESNREEIERKILTNCRCIPSRIKVQTWFSFLIQHGVKPYQGAVNESLYGKTISGMILNNGEYGCYQLKGRSGKPQRRPYSEEKQFYEHYFTKSVKILSDRLSKFVIRANTATNGEVIRRISRIYSHVFVDEIQDLAGYDLEILKLLFQTETSVLMVGDPRQVTYLTHHESKYRQYKDGNVVDFVKKECKGKGQVEIDETTLQISHRNNADICEYSSRLYDKAKYLPVIPCECEPCRSRSEKDDGVYLVKTKDVNAYLKLYAPIQLRWNTKRKVDSDYPVSNMGDSKGRTYDHVLIYPTTEMDKWVHNNRLQMMPMTTAKFYVAITRARYSVAIVSDSLDGLSQGILKEFNPSNIKNGG